MALTKITPQMFDTSAAGHDFNIDNGTFVVDASANRVGIGTATPSTLLDVNGVLTATSIAGTLTTAAQTNITSVGTLSSLTVSGALNGTLSTAAQTNITSLGTLTSLTVDTMTLNTGTISSTASNFILDAAGELHLDADDGIIRIRDGGGDYGMFQISNSDFIIRSMVADKHLIFKGNDGGSVITALTLDMSAAGTATFNSNIIGGGHLTLPDNGAVRLGADPDTLFYHDTNHTYLDHTGTGNLKLRAASQVDIQDTDGTTCANFVGGGAVTLYHNNAAKLATASGGVTVTGNLTTTSLFAAKTSSGIGNTGLEVFSTGQTYITRAGGPLALNNTSGVGGQIYLYAGGTYTANISTVSGGISFGTGAGGSVADNKVVIDSSGSVGIGTTGPSRKLHIKDNGQIKLENTGTSAWAGLDIHTSVGTNNYDMYMGMLDSNGRFFIDVNSNGEDLTILQNGNVGIGVSSPTNKFHVEYNTNASVANLAEVDNYSAIRFGDFRADQSDNLYFMSVGGGKVGIQARDDSANGVAKKLSLNPYGGTVGVGITDPSANLEVRGSGANGQFFIGGTTTNTYGKIYSDNDGVLILAADGGNNAANSYLGLEVDGTARVAVNGTGTVFGDVSVLADGMTATPNDKNQAEIGAGYLRLKRDDTASAQQLTFDKNGSTHSYFETGTSGLIYVVNSGDHRFNADVIPDIADSYDLGTSALRWRNGYFNDFHLSNEGIEGGNDVDGTTGDWTIQEGEEHLYIINNKTGKKFRFALEEVT